MYIMCHWRVLEEEDGAIVIAVWSDAGEARVGLPVGSCTQTPSSIHTNLHTLNPTRMNPRHPPKYTDALPTWPSNPNPP